MSRRCRPGVRARVIGGGRANLGKVVCVVRPYFGELINDATWPENVHPWVVTSLGNPLRSFLLDTGEEAPLAMTIVLDDQHLEPLRDDDEFVSDQGTMIERGLSSPRLLDTMTSGVLGRRVEPDPAQN